MVQDGQLSKIGYPYKKTKFMRPVNGESATHVFLKVLKVNTWAA